MKTVEERLARLSRVRWEAMPATLQNDVTAFNTDVGNTLTALAVPAFGPDNALFAPKSWLFDVDRLLRPRDPKNASRGVTCHACEHDLYRRSVCERASIDHW